MPTNLGTLYEILASWVMRFDSEPEITIILRPDAGLIVHFTWSIGEIVFQQRRMFSKSQIEMSNPEILKLVEESFLEGMEREYCKWEVGEE